MLSFCRYIIILKKDQVSGYRCVSDCRPRGCEFDPGSPTFVAIDQEIISSVILLPSAEGLLSVTSQIKVCAQSTGCG